MQPFRNAVIYRTSRTLLAWSRGLPSPHHRHLLVFVMPASPCLRPLSSCSSPFQSNPFTSVTFSILPIQASLFSFSLSLSLCWMSNAKKHPPKIHEFIFCFWIVGNIPTRMGEKGEGCVENNIKPKSQSGTFFLSFSSSLLLSLLPSSISLSFAQIRFLSQSSLLSPSFLFLHTLHSQSQRHTYTWRHVVFNHSPPPSSFTPLRHFSPRVHPSGYELWRVKSQCLCINMCRQTLGTLFQAPSQCNLLSYHPRCRSLLIIHCIFSNRLRTGVFFQHTPLVCYISYHFSFPVHQSISMKDIRDSRDANSTTAQEVTSITDLQAMLGRFWEAHSRQFRGKKPYILILFLLSCFSLFIRWVGFCFFLSSLGVLCWQYPASPLNHHESRQIVFRQST